MSEEQLKAFLEKVQADTSRQEQLKADGVSSADVIAIAKAAGFSITTEDLNTLSDAELEGVWGGQNSMSAAQCSLCRDSYHKACTGKCIC